MSQRLITGGPDACKCCNCPDSVVFSGGDYLLQGHGPPYGVTGIDPPPITSLAWKYDDMDTDITYTWYVELQAWNGTPP